MIVPGHPLFGLPFPVGPSSIIPPPPIPPSPPQLKTVPTPALPVPAFTIPTDHSTPEVPPYEQQTVLSQVTYTLGLRWNARVGVWTAKVNSAAGTLLADSIPVRNGLPLAFWAWTVPGFPPGALWSVPVDHNPADAGQDQLGGRVLLMYTE